MVPKDERRKTNEEFTSIMDATFEQEAQEGLDMQLGRLREWRQQHVQNNDPASLAKLIRQLLREPAPRTGVVVTLAAAMWRLTEEDS